MAHLATWVSVLVALPLCGATWTPVRPSTERPLKLLMCITGQLGRLEVASKLENFVMPNVAKGHKVDVVAVLDSRDDPRFVNALVEINDTRRNTLSALKEHASKFRLVDFTQPENPEAPKWYAIKLSEGKPQLDSMERVRKHVRQFATIERCYDEIQDLEFENGQRYDEIFRVRDDAFIMQPIKPLHEYTTQPDVLVPHCDNWYGINDKAALMLRPAAGVYFKNYLKTLFYGGENHQIRNPETLTLYMLQKGNVTIHQDGERLPVAPLRGDQEDGCLHMIFHRCWEKMLEAINYTPTEKHPWCQNDLERSIWGAPHFVHHDKLEE